MGERAGRVSGAQPLHMYVFLRGATPKVFMKIKSYAYSRKKGKLSVLLDRVRVDLAWRERDRKQETDHPFWLGDVGIN